MQGQHGSKRVKTEEISEREEEESKEQHGGKGVKTEEFNEREEEELNRRAQGPGDKRVMRTSSAHAQLVINPEDGWGNVLEIFEGPGLGLLPIELLEKVNVGLEAAGEVIYTAEEFHSIRGMAISARSHLALEGRQEEFVQAVEADIAQFARICHQFGCAPFVGAQCLLDRMSPTRREWFRQSPECAAALESFNPGSPEPHLTKVKQLLTHSGVTFSTVHQADIGEVLVMSMDHEMVVMDGSMVNWVLPRVGLGGLFPQSLEETKLQTAVNKLCEVHGPGAVVYSLGCVPYRLSLPPQVVPLDFRVLYRKH